MENIASVPNPPNVTFSRRTSIRIVEQSLDPTSAFSFKIVGSLRTALHGSTMSITQLRVAKGLECLKLDNQQMKNITLLRQKSNLVFVLKIQRIF